MQHMKVLQPGQNRSRGRLGFVLLAKRSNCSGIYRPTSIKHASDHHRIIFPEGKGAIGPFYPQLGGWDKDEKRDGKGA